MKSYYQISIRMEQGDHEEFKKKAIDLGYHSFSEFLKISLKTMNTRREDAYQAIQIGN